MRLKLNRYLEVSYIPEITKVKIKFLLFPKIIDNDFRWLEFAKILYGQYESYTWEYEGVYPYDYWKAIKFLPYDPVKDCDIYLNEGCAHVDGYLCNIDECEIKNKQK
jgi:hypothetical protein